MALTASPTGSGHSAKRRSPPRLLLFCLAAVLVVGGLTALASHYANGYFLFSPGTAPSITSSAQCRASQGQLALPGGAPCVKLVLPPGKSHEVNGKVLMVDVEVSQAGPWDWARYELGLLGGDRQLIPVAAYAGPTPTSELGCQDTQMMQSATQDAALAALAELHYRVGEYPLGAEVTTVLAGAPAWSAGIKCNDLITAVNGKPVIDATEFTDLVQSLPVGALLKLSDHTSPGGPARTVEVRFAKTPPKMVALGFPPRAYLGLAVETRVRLVLPFQVSINAGDIGGPSAGLAFALGILDALSGGDLTGGHVVAATGTIAPDGQVGDVSGVQEKTIAVEDAGAQVFFVPTTELHAAKSVASARLRIVAVTTLAEALRVLQQQYGGKLPLPQA